MDYCHPCRRHLNGALTCAGCGTPAEELRRDDPGSYAAHPVYELDEVSEPTGRRRARQAPSRRKAAGARRARKRRGRKVLLGAVGLVLAAGVLSLAELAIEEPGDDGAATYVKEKTRVETEEAPEPTGPDETPQGPDRVTEPAVSASAFVRPKGTGTGTTAGTGSGGRGDGGGSGAGDGGEGKPTVTGPADGFPSPSPSSSADDDPAGRASPSPSDEPSTDGTAGPTPSVEPEPTPTETCRQFLFWCI
jgi:hypothetical protein